MKSAILSWTIVVVSTDITYRTSSRIVVDGKSAPYQPWEKSPFLAVTGLAVPYGLPRLFIQTTKNLSVSNAFPGPRSGPHQSLTSALPDNAWQMIMTLLAFGDSLPQLMYATGTFLISTPDSSVKVGIVMISRPGTRFENGLTALGTLFSVLS